MSSVQTILDSLEKQKPIGYQAEKATPNASEPMALSAIALLAHGRTNAAQRMLSWLVQAQSKEGSVGVTSTEKTPRWPTGLATLAWKLHDIQAEKPRYQGCIERAIHWTLSFEGKTVARNDLYGHNTMLVAWPWVEGTHSWLEPTAFHTLALTSAGYAGHKRALGAVELILDRQIPTGGWNYGNTYVLGQKLLPHVQPTGLGLTALAFQNDKIEQPRNLKSKVTPSLAYLKNMLPKERATASLCFGLIGLTAFGERPREAKKWLHDCWGRISDGKNQSPVSAYKKALLALASLEKPLQEFFPQAATTVNISTSNHNEL